MISHIALLSFVTIAMGVVSTSQRIPSLIHRGLTAYVDTVVEGLREDFGNVKEETEQDQCDRA